MSPFGRVAGPGASDREQASLEIDVYLLKARQLAFPKPGVEGARKQRTPARMISLLLEPGRPTGSTHRALRTGSAANLEADRGPLQRSVPGAGHRVRAAPA